MRFNTKTGAHFESDLAQYQSGFGLNIFYLYSLHIEQHIKKYNNIQYTNGIQKKVFRYIRINLDLTCQYINGECNSYQIYQRCVCPNIFI